MKSTYVQLTSLPALTNDAAHVLKELNAVSQLLITQMSDLLSRVWGGPHPLLVSI